MALFLLFSRRRNRGAAASDPVFTVTPPTSATNSPYPRPARNSGAAATAAPPRRAYGAPGSPGGQSAPGTASYAFRADNVTNSTFTTDNLPYTRGATMASPFTGASEAIAESFGHFEPQRPEDYEEFFKGLPEFFGDQSSTLGNLTDRARDTMPLNPAVLDELGEMKATMAGLRDKADELNAHFRNVHAEDLKRAHEPRAGESTMNYNPA